MPFGAIISTPRWWKEGLPGPDETGTPLDGEPGGRQPQFRREDKAADPVAQRDRSCADRRGGVGVTGSGRAYTRFNALSTALIGASSMLVSTPAPHRVAPSISLIWMYEIAL